MRILVTGACGFVGSTLISHWRSQGCDHQFIGLDNFLRQGSHLNKARLQAMDVQLIHGDMRNASDLAALPKVDFVIDAAANPSVLAGLGGEGQSQQLVEHNLVGTLNLLELCRKNQAGLILLSTSRVYSIEHLTSLPLLIKEHAFTLDQDALPTHLQSSVTASGINETFSTQAPISLYGATKLASEVMAMEYGRAFDLPVWINRCGVMAGAGQFARADQGIFSFWIHRWSEKKALRYIGFGGHGYQVRDCLHPADLCPLIDKQLVEPLISDKPRIVNLSGGILSAMSLAQLSQWCCTRLTPAGVASDITPRPYDLPWVVLDHSLATQAWGWKPQITKMQILEQLADFAEENPDWLIQTGGDR